MDTEGLSVICAGIGTIEVDDEGNVIGYIKGQYCLDNLKDLLRFLRRDDPQTRDVFKQVCKWNIVSKYLIPTIELYHEDSNLLLNAVKVLVFLTMPIEPSSTDISQQLEYLWGLKSALTNSDVAAVIVSFLERPLENLERGTFSEDDWKLVQLVLTLFRNILAVQEIPTHQKSGGLATQLLSMRDRFLELLFRENVMDIMLVISQCVGSSNVYLRQDNLLLLEIFHYILMGQDPELIVRAHLKESKEDEQPQTSLNSLQFILEEEKKRRNICKLNNLSRHSQFSGTFARLTMDGSKAVIKGNPNSSHNVLLKAQNVTRGPTKRTVWDHPRLPSTEDKILELLHGFVNQFLSGGYNVLMQSIREDIEKEHPSIQKSDVAVFFQVAEFVTSFQFYKYSASKTKEEGDTFETLSDKDAVTSDFSGQICGPIAASLNETMFQLIISKWRHAYDGLKETNDYQFLSAAGSLLKNMIRMLDLILKLLPENSKEPQTARILLYKLFYDQTEEGMTQFLLNLIKTFDIHKQPKSNLSDLVEIIHKVVRLMDNLQSRGALRVSRKSRKVKKNKIPEGTESGDKLSGDHSCIQNETGISTANQSAENQPLLEVLPNANSTGEDVVPDDNEHENRVEEDENSQVGLEPMGATNSEHVNEDMLDGTNNFSEDEQLHAYNEVDFKVSTLVSAFANHNIIQKLCWLLKFYKSNSLATNYYIISMLRRISDDLELHPMLYQLSLLTTFYDILIEQKSCPCKDYAGIVDFLTCLVRKMLKKMKKQPLLFVELLFWKTRRECHYINAEYLLSELGHLKKESANWNNSQGDEEIGSSPTKVWTRRSIADALGEDEADVVITHDSRCQQDKLEDVIEGFASTSGSNSGKDVHNGEQLMEDESQLAPRRRKKLVLDGDLERQIKDLYEKFKDEPHCSRHIAEVLDPDGKISPAQISNMLKRLGLAVAPKRKMGDADAEGHLSTSPNQLDGDKRATNHKSVNLEGSLLVQHLQKKKRVQAFNEAQEALIKVLYEQFKDHRRCSYMIANALDEDGKITAAQVSRKLKQLGLSLPQKSSGGKMHPKDADLMDLSNDRINESDDETLVTLIKRKKMEADPTGQVGVVVDVNICVDLLAHDGSIIKDVSSKNLNRIRDFTVGDYVVLGHWLGRIDDVLDNVTILFDDGSICKVSKADPLNLKPISKNILEDGHFPYYPGQRVRASSSSVFKNSRWLSGLWKANRLEGTVTKVTVGSVFVYWIASAGYGPYSSTAPAEEQSPKNLKLLSCFAHANWQLGDWCLLPSSVLSSSASMDKGISKLELSDSANNELDSNQTGSGCDSEEATVEETNGNKDSMDLDPADVLEGNDGNDKSNPSRDSSSCSSSISVSKEPVHEAWPLHRKKIRKVVIRKDKRARKKEESFEKALLIANTRTKVDVAWQDGTIERGLNSTSLIPIDNPGDHEFVSEQYVVEKTSDDGESISEARRVGVVRSVNAKERTACVRWLKKVARAEDPREFDKEEVVSVYELEGHPDYDYCYGDVVVRLSPVSVCLETASVGESTEKSTQKIEESGIKINVNVQTGETCVQFSDLSWVGNITGLKNGDIEVTWADGMVSMVGPQAIYVVGRDDDDESIAAGSEISDAASWETVNDDEMEVLEDSREDIERENSSSVTSEAEESGENDFGRAAALSVPLAAFRFVTRLASGIFSRGSRNLDPIPLEIKAECEHPSPVVNDESTSQNNSGNKNERYEEVVSEATETLEASAALCSLGNEDAPATASCDNDTCSLKHFDITKDPSDHYFIGANGQSNNRKWFKKVQQDWSILQNNLPEEIYVRVYEDRMDLLRAVIVGPYGTPYQDGLFFFDFHLPPEYPDVPPSAYYHSGGWRINPNLYEEGKVCLSLLNTWTGRGNEVWDPKSSSILQVLVSLQGLVLNSKPYFNEAGYDKQVGTAEGEKNSLSYNENTFLLNCKTMMYLMRKPPKDFEVLIKEHFRRRGHNILKACDAYMKGYLIGSLTRDASVSEKSSQNSTSVGFKLMLAKIVPKLFLSLSEVGADCEEFKHLKDL